MTLKAARRRWGGYARHVGRLTDFRLRECLVHYGCGGILFRVGRVLFTQINCGKCGAEDVRAVMIVTARQAQDRNPY